MTFEPLLHGVIPLLNTHVDIYSSRVSPIRVNHGYK